jgi:hypothetical protein
MENRINVAKDGTHFFRTDWYPGSEIYEIAKVLAQKFPATEGWKLTMAHRKVTYQHSPLEN